MRSSDAGEAMASPLLFLDHFPPLPEEGGVAGDSLEDDQDAGDVESGVDEDALDSDDVDTDQIASRE